MSGEFYRLITEWISANPGKAIGACAGFILGILIILFGLLKTFFIFLLVLIGVLIGKLRDDRVNLFTQLGSLFRRRGNRD